MREIEFRGLRSSGQWVYGSLVVTNQFIAHKPKNHTKHWIVTNAFGNGGWFNIRSRYHVKTESVGQYTGFKDKNGEKIYEGDIIKSCIGRICKVIFKDAGFCYERIDSNGFIDYIFFGGHHYIETVLDCEIIGNIHQNPELLEVKSERD